MFLWNIASTYNYAQCYNPDGQEQCCFSKEIGSRSLSYQKFILDGG
jgi:hypothetical protein